jgi:hypothetical protein
MLQIEAFVLYHATILEPRVIRLKPGLNVITGWRNTGKSSLIEIVDYCFGRQSLQVSEGKIRDTVAWYALILRNDDKHLFVARPAPDRGRAGSTEGVVLPLQSAEPPGHNALLNNCLVDQVRSEISSFAGFADTQFVPPEGARRPALDLHIGHALPVTMQDEEDIYSKSRLFHRGEEREVMQALRDTFPYMVGAADAHAPLLRAQLTALRSELRHIDRQLADLESASQEGDERGLTLLVLAGEVGLAQSPDLDSEPPPQADILAALRSAAAQDPEAPTAYAPTGDAERLLEQRRQLGVQLRSAERDQALLRDFGQLRDAFSVETNEQRARLATLGLTTNGEEHERCPVCDTVLEQPDPSTAQLVTHLRHLELDLEAASQMEPRTRAALEEAAAHVESLTNQIRAVTGALNDLDRQERSERRAATLAARRARTQGLIEEYLRAAPEDSRALKSRLNERRTVIEAEMAQLEGRLDAEAEQERLEGALDLIGADMTTLARELGLEHSKHGQVGLRLAQTTLTITTREGRTFPLRAIGGGGTRVGYHLAAHLAIHRLLRVRNRPTPAFLMLDHPTGPFYPEDVPIGEEPQLADESDQVIVESIFALIRSVADDLDGALQILVTDHAKFYGERWFEQALVEDWRHGRGLIPAEWLHADG